MPVITKNKRRRSERGNWLIVAYLDGQIYWCKWVKTWAGVGMSRREFYKQWGRRGRVMVMNIECMADFAITKGANDTYDLDQLFEKE